MTPGEIAAVESALALWRYSGGTRVALCRALEAIDLLPPSPLVHMHMAQLELLSAGGWCGSPRVWRLYDERLDAPWAHGDAPAWLHRRELLRLPTHVYCDDGGVGDAVQFARFVPPYARGAYIVHPPPGLEWWFRTMGFSEPLPGDGDDNLNRAVSFQSLTCGWSSTPPPVPASPPPVPASPPRVYLPDPRRVMVALDLGSTRYWDAARRNLPAAVSQAIARRLYRIYRYPVQVEFIDSDVPWRELAQAPPGLVVTGDTALVHVAGSLGIPTALLLHHVPNWRWGLSGTTTPWYPSVRIFRQRVPGDWSRVADDVIAAVKGGWPYASAV